MTPRFCCSGGNDGCAELLAITHFDERRELWHHDRRRSREELALVGERLRMITRRGGDDATLLLLRRQ